MSCRTLLCAATALALTCTPSAAAAQETARPEEQRIEYDALMAYVEAPVRRLDAGDLPGAEAAFERLLAARIARLGAASVVVADHLTAFGLALFARMEDEPSARAMRARSLHYLRRAIPAYRAAFGPDHPEVALAIGTYGDAALTIAPDDPPRDLDAALEDAHRIYAAAHGPGDAAAVVTLVKRARVLGSPSRTGGDSERIAAAAAAFRRTLQAIDAAPDGADTSPYQVLFGLAELYVRNGRRAEASAVVREIGERFRASGPDGLACMQVAMLAGRYEEFLLGRGDTAAAAELARVAWQGDKQCFGADFDMIPPIDLPR